MFYSPLTEDQRQLIVKTLGFKNVGDLFSDMPTDGVKPDISIMSSLTEIQLQKE